MRLDDLANELVRYTAEIISDRTINVMNTQGIIIASSDDSRIGTFHQGALDAVLTGQPVAIEPEDVPHFPGAREGYNMPIRIDGDIIGVIGIYGKPSEIKLLARLLEVFAVKYLQLESMSVPMLKEAELRSRLLRTILYPTASSAENARLLMRELHFEIRFPATLAVMSPADGSMDPSWGAKLSRVLLNKGILSPDNDLWAIDPDSMIILSCGTELADKLLRSDLLLPKGPYRLSLGDRCRDMKEIPRALNQAVILNSISTSGFLDIRDPANRCHYLIRDYAEREDDYFCNLLGHLAQDYSPAELKVMLQSATVYYDESHSVTKAAERLFVHKNTLQYRLKKLESALSITEWPEFRKELLIRILIEAYLRKQGLKTLL